MKSKILWGGLIVVIVAAGAALYLTRPPSAPSPLPRQEESDSLSKTPEARVYRIDPARSTVEFQIDEILRGSPFTVVGTTDQITGTLTLGDTVSFGTMTVNARTFKTDNERRDGALARLILKSEDPAQEFITFVPTSATPEGATYVVQGNLTMAGVTAPATFRVTMDATDLEVRGTATADLKRSDFGLVIPSLSFVAGVPDEFSVRISVVAPRDAAANTSPWLIGTWRSAQDQKFIRAFRENGTVIDSYEGTPEAATQGVWKISEKDGAAPHITITFPDSEPLEFSVAEHSENSLTLTYLNRGGALEFTRVR